MKNPFKVGDVVYTCEHNDGSLRVGESMADNGVVAGTANDYKGHNSRWIPLCYLSFTPWPEPCQVRPLEDGLWAISGKFGDYIAYHENGKWYHAVDFKKGLLMCDPSIDPGMDNLPKRKVME